MPTRNVYANPFRCATLRWASYAGGRDIHALERADREKETAFALYQLAQKYNYNHGKDQEV